VATAVYLDDSGISPQLARDYGWAPIGAPVTSKRLGHRTPNLNISAETRQLIAEPGSQLEFRPA
jgi:hypothetical protein